VINLVYVLLAQGFEEIEALTVVDVLRRAGIDIQIVGVDADMITGSHGITVKADCTIEQVNSEEVEMIVLPGGMPGTKNLENSDKVQELLKNAVVQKKWVAAICAAPMILGNKGYLKDVEAICYPGFEKYLAGAVIKDAPVNVSKRFITSKGPGTAMKFALKIVSVLKDDDTAHQLKVGMQVQ